MDREQPVQAAVPADLNTPDKVLYGLTARQLAILAGTGAVLWLTYHLLAPFVPPVAVVVVAMPIGALAAAVALGRRDGLTMDRWLAAALRAARSPHRMVAAPAGTIAAPGWAPATQDSEATAGKTATMPLAPLRLPARAIAASGVVDVDGARVAVTAASTVNFDLRTAGEQHALVDGMSRWLNALSGPGPGRHFHPPGRHARLRRPGRGPPRPAPTPSPGRCRRRLRRVPTVPGRGPGPPGPARAHHPPGRPGQ